MDQRFPGVFQYLSCDEDEGVDDSSMKSQLDLQLSSEDGGIDDRIMMMSQCVQMELSTPIPVQGPLTAVKICNNAPQYGPMRCENPRINLPQG